MWKQIGQRLEAALRCENQTEAAKLVLEIARHSDAVNHHADFTIKNYNVVVISITTHDVGTITVRDEELALWIDTLLSEKQGVEVII